MVWVAGLLAVVAAVYQILAIAACLRHLARKAPVAPLILPGISILKPVLGLQPGFEDALTSHLTQDYPEFELLIGHQDPADPAVPVIEQAGGRHFLCPSDFPNRKAGVLADLAGQARFPVLVVNDADIRVPAGYLLEVAAALADPGVGVVTCLYRAEGDTFASRFEALGVATDFAPSALVAPMVGVSEFGFGSTLAFRRSDLDAIGGFPALADYLADDYQLGARIHRLGRRNVISRVVVTTRLHAGSWAAVWRHQVRWARTIRLSRFDGYVGIPVTFATVWALLAAICGDWWLAGGLLALRLLMAATAGWFVLGSTDSVRLLALVPVRDLYAGAVWVAGLFGHSVEWGGRVLTLDDQGRIVRSTQGRSKL